MNLETEADQDSSREKEDLFKETFGQFRTFSKNSGGILRKDAEIFYFPRGIKLLSRHLLVLSSAGNL